MKVTAVGLVHVPGGARTPDRWWYRAIVVRHARDRRLQLVDVLELTGDRKIDSEELKRLATVAARSRATVLVTHGIRTDLAGHLAERLGLRHLPAPDRPGPYSARHPGGRQTG
jgi:hypothetical protein